MKVLLDTNIILDVLTAREPFLKASSTILKLCGRQITGYIATSQTTDIFYILCREGIKSHQAKAIIHSLLENTKMLDVISTDVNSALKSEMIDYEDALLVYNAKRNKMDCIITRNKKDFGNAPLSTYTPEEFLETYFSP